MGQSLQWDGKDFQEKHGEIFLKSFITSFLWNETPWHICPQLAEGLQISLQEATRRDKVWSGNQVSFVASIGENPGAQASQRPHLLSHPCLDPSFWEPKNTHALSHLSQAKSVHHKGKDVKNIWTNAWGTEQQFSTFFFMS